MVVGLWKRGMPIAGSGGLGFRQSIRGGGSSRWRVKAIGKGRNYCTIFITRIGKSFISKAFFNEFFFLCFSFCFQLENDFSRRLSNRFASRRQSIKKR